MTPGRDEPLARLARLTPGNSSELCPAGDVEAEHTSLCQKLVQRDTRPVNRPFLERRLSGLSSASKSESATLLFCHQTHIAILRPCSRPPQETPIPKVPSVGHTDAVPGVQRKKGHQGVPETRWKRSWSMAVTDKRPLLKRPSSGFLVPANLRRSPPPQRPRLCPHGPVGKGLRRVKHAAGKHVSDSCEVVMPIG